MKRVLVLNSTFPAGFRRVTYRDGRLSWVQAAGGSDALSNRTTLCTAHHLRGVHEGVVRCTGSAPDGLIFELGVRSEGPPLVRFRMGDVRVA